MNILHIGIFNNREPQNGLRRALKSVSDIYVEHDWQLLRGQVNEYIELQLATGLFDTVFMQIQTPNVISIPLLQKWHTKVKFYNFNGDLRDPMPKWYFDVAPYTIALFTNTDYVDELKKGGCDAHYFQVGYDDRIYNPDGTKVNGGEIVFMGNNFGGSFHLSGMRKTIVEGLQKRYPKQFQVYGANWNNLGKHTNYRQDVEAGMYRGSKFGININHLDAGRYTSDRMFRLMACGTMCLTWKYPQIELEFEDGVHLRTWTSLEELCGLIDYYTQHKEERARIAAAGCELVLYKCNWDYRIKNDFLNIHNGTKRIA